MYEQEGGKNVNISKRFRKISFKNKKMMEKKLVREALFTFKVIVSTTTKKKNQGCSKQH